MELVDPNVPPPNPLSYFQVLAHCNIQQYNNIIIPPFIENISNGKTTIDFTLK